MENCLERRYRGYDDWETTFSGNVIGKPAGVFDNGTAQSGFGYRKIIDYPAGVPIGNISRAIDLTFVIEIRESAADNAALIFKQEVELGFTVVAQYNFGVVANLSWWPSQGGGKIYTSDINGQHFERPTEEEPAAAARRRAAELQGKPLPPLPTQPGAWQYLDTRNPQPVSEQGDFCFDLEDSVLFTSEDIHIRGVWYSPLYLADIPAGAVLVVKQDDMRLARVERFGSWGWTFKKATMRLAATSNATGVIHFGRARGADTEIIRTMAGPEDLREMQVFPKSSQPSLWRDDANVLYYGLYHHDAYKLYYSWDDGATRRTLQWDEDRFKSQTKEGDAEEKIGEQITLWTSRHKNIVTAGNKEGTIITAAHLGEHVYVASSADGFVIRGATKRKRDEPYQLLAMSTADGRFLWLLTNSKDHWLESTDNGLHWSERDPEEIA